MNRSELVTDLKNMIGPGVEVDNSGLITWINDSYLAMVDEIATAQPDYFVKSSTASIVANVQEYELPTDFESLIMVNVKYDTEWRRAMPMPNINFVPIHARTNSNQGFSEADPQYYILGTEIGLMPIPTSTVTDGLKIWYAYTPLELTSDSQEPDIPKKYHHIIKYGAYANYLDQDDEHVAAERMRQRFDERVQRMMENLSVRQHDQPKSVEIVTNSDLYLSNRDIVY